MSTQPLQSLLWPEPGLVTERDLFFRLDGPVGFSMSKQWLEFQPGGIARFDTYGNLFNCGKWHKYCGLTQLALELEGKGRFELTVWLIQPERSWDRVVNDVITLTPDQPLHVDLTPDDGFKSRGLLVFELRALSNSYLTDAAWVTDQPPLRRPELMLSVTTFRREDAVRRTAERFAAFAASSAIGDNLHMTVVDNGQSAEIAPSPYVTLIGNENLGGSGGFARGLLEAQRRGASHCLFMDDDASVHMGAVERSWTFLAYATDPRIAVAGAVANAQHRWKLWENGALFHGVCLPQHMGTDLRDITETSEMEFDSTATQPHNFYGGWWYFAFPVDQVRHMPFPFFVRGDDVSFSLVHDFVITTLPGVISYQDEDFSVKESPLTVYLDLRSHLAHHLSLPSMEVGRKGINRIIARFWLRSLLDCHYETLEAVALALEDVARGPEFFEQNADMATRRAEIGALTQTERWKADDDHLRLPPRNRLPSGNLVIRGLMKATLNGHLFPFFARFGDRRTLPATLRGARRKIWGAAQLTYLSMDGQRSYTVTHDKAHAARVSARIFRAARQIRRRYPELREDWQQGYARLTERAYWQSRLGLDAEPRE